MRKIFLFIMLIFIGTSLVGFSEVTSKEKKVLMEKFKKEMKKSEGKKDIDTKSIENLIALTKEYIKGNPSEDYAYEYLGNLLMKQKKYDEAEKNFLKSIELGNNDTGITSLIFLYDTKYDRKYSLVERVFDNSIWEEKLLSDEMGLEERELEEILLKKMESEEFKNDTEYQKIKKIIEKMNIGFKTDTGFYFLGLIRQEKINALFLENIKSAEFLTSFYEKEVEDLPKAKKWARTTKELIENSKNKKDYSETLDYVNKILEQR